MMGPLRADVGGTPHDPNAGASFAFRVLRGPHPQRPKVEPRNTRSTRTCRPRSIASAGRLLDLRLMGGKGCAREKAVFDRALTSFA